MDIMTPAQRSERMSLVRGQDTRPERAVRRLVHALGYRFRLQGLYRGQRLPGKPDLVFPGRKKVIFVHGCFWHQHAGCRAGRPPRTRVEFWVEKLGGNVERDERKLADLRAAGWECLVVWQCELKSPDLADRLAAFLGPVTPATAEGGPAAPKRGRRPPPR